MTAESVRAARTPTARGRAEAFAEAGFDEVYVQQIGPDQQAFFEAYAQHVLPRFA